MKVHIACEAVVGVLAITSVSWAADVVIGDARVTLVPPSAHCELDEGRPADSRIINVTRALLKGQNRLLLISADCEELAAFRAGRRSFLDEVAQYQTLEQADDTAIAGDSDAAIRQACTDLRRHGADLTTQALAHLRPRLEDAVKGVKMNEARFLGVIGEEPGVCYMVTVQKEMTAAAGERTMITLGAVTAAKQRIVLYYLIVLHRDAVPLTDLLVRHRANVARFRAAN